MAAPKRFPAHRFVSLSDEHAQRIKEIAEEEVDSESGVMRRAIQEFIERWDKKAARRR